MGLLKKLTELTSSNSKMDVLKPESKENQKISYHQDGYDTSKSCRGNSYNLQASLDAIYQRFENNCKVDFVAQEQLKQPYSIEQKGKKTALLNKVEELEKLEDRVTSTNEDIGNLKQECRKVKINPQDYFIDIDKRASAKFWVGISFLFPLTIYILIFYISTSYSAFFRLFDPGTGVFQGMFYPKALSSAYEDGILELGFVLFIPFVFFALGYLIHMFQEKRGYVNWIKIAGLLIITFLFDAILAYLIDEKLYNLNKTFDSDPFNISVAFQSVSFWVIIFAGFVSYMVWGLVFDFVMKEYADRDKIKSFINNKEDEIFDKEQIKLKHKNKIVKVEEELFKIKNRISELQNIIDGFILPVRNYKSLSAEYLQGWQEYISAALAMGKDEKNIFLSENKKVYEKHIKKLELETDDYQNKVYTNTL